MIKQKKILIIDDEADFCFLLKKFLERRDCEILLAGSLESGLQLLQKEQPDIVFLDNNLPDGYGWEKIEQISKMVPQAKLNLISAYQHPLKIVVSKNVQILEKPLDFRRLNEYL